MSMLIGTTENGTPLTIEASDLTTHGVILGRTGSGKTGATVTAIEEAVLSGASVIVLDPKGDLTNLALVFPGLTTEEFAPWTEDGKDPAALAARARKELGHLAPNVQRWKDSADVTIYAPGKTRGGGVAVNVLASLNAPTGSLSAQGLRNHAGSLVASILSAIGHSADPMTDPANVYLTDVVVDAWAAGQPMGLETWADMLNNPPTKFQTIDGMLLDEFFPKTKRMKIARAIIGFRRQATKWLEGEALSVERYIGVNKPKVSVFTMRHLDEQERQFFAAMLMAAIVDYMFRAPASNDLKLLVVLDEARGYLPPYPLNPPTKKPICTLLAQGRAQGIGMLIGTQNPNDMDYKALTNVGTWWLGKLRPRDCARDLKKELSDRGVDQSVLSSIPERHFLILKKNGEHAVTRIRWAYSFLRGPINGQELLRLTQTTGSFQYDDLNGSGSIELYFKLSNASSTPAKAYVQLSLDNGQTWSWCSLGGAFDRYATTPAGGWHKVTWDTVRDLGARQAQGLLRLWIDNAPGVTASFTVNNSKARGRLAQLFG